MVTVEKVLEATKFVQTNPFVHFFRADSVTWNPHKLMGATLQCSAILLKKKVNQSNCVIIIKIYFENVHLFHA